MSTTTTMQSLPVPEYTDAPNVPDHFLALAQAIENKLVMRFTNAADRDSRVSSPVTGMYCFVTDILELQCYSGGWRSVWSAKTGANDTRWGQFVTYIAGSRPSAGGLQAGILGMNRTTGAVETVTPSNAWQIAGGSKVGTFANAIYTRVNLGLGAAYNTSALTFTVANAGTAVNIRGRAQFQMSLTGSDFFQAVWADVYVNKPGGGVDSLPGLGELPYGHVVTQFSAPFEAFYVCAAAGTYSVYLGITTGGGSPGTNTTIDRTTIVVEPYINLNAF